jgi:hypothetical protein
VNKTIQDLKIAGKPVLIKLIFKRAEYFQLIVSLGLNLNSSNLLLASVIAFFFLFHRFFFVIQTSENNVMKQ